MFRACLYLILLGSAAFLSADVFISNRNGDRILHIGSEGLQNIKQYIVLIFGSLGTKNQVPPESFEKQSWFQGLLIFWSPGTKIASQDFLGDLGSWFPRSRNLTKYFFIFWKPGNQEPRSPRKSWGAIWVPGTGGSKTCTTHLILLEPWNHEPRLLPKTCSGILVPGSPPPKIEKKLDFLESFRTNLQNQVTICIWFFTLPGNEYAIQRFSQKFSLIQGPVPLKKHKTSTC